VKKDCRTGQRFWRG